MSDEYDNRECGCEECPDCYRREIRGLEKALQVMTEARAADAARIRDECAKAAVAAVNDCRADLREQAARLRERVQRIKLIVAMYPVLPYLPGATTMSDAEKEPR